MATVNKAPVLDINAQGEIDGKPTLAYDLEGAEDKPWRLPGMGRGAGNVDIGGILCCVNVGRLPMNTNSTKFIGNLDAPVLCCNSENCILGTDYFFLGIAAGLRAQVELLFCAATLHLIGSRAMFSALVTPECALQARTSPTTSTMGSLRRRGGSTARNKGRYAEVTQERCGHFAYNSSCIHV